MLYLNNAHIAAMGIDWQCLTDQMRCTTRLLHRKEYSQPLKPYLRYNNPANRIIAMPAYIGGGDPGAGIKWIASFPDNIRKGLPRAHCIIILNEVETGKPLCTINAASVSCIRTASVTGLVIDEYLGANEHRTGLTAGIIGLGPIGRMHLQMLESLFGKRIDRYLVYDLIEGKTTGLPGELQEKIRICSSWQEAYEPADIFITCTVARERYIDLPPKKGSLQLNVSLRDYLPQIRRHVDVMIVDDWEEICRENTDIEIMHKQYGLQPEDTLNIGELIACEKLKGMAPGQVVMFNPMGMAIFDIAVANHYYRLARESGVGVLLED